MLKVYERLSHEGKIGPFDAEGRPRPYCEYPKRITVYDADGKASDRIVQNQREELAFAGETVPGIKAQDDPVLLERNRLAEENEKLRQELRDIAEASARKAPVASPRAPQGQVSGKAEGVLSNAV